MTRPITMHDYIATLARRIASDIHPSAQSICAEYLIEMEYAPPSELPRLLALWRDKITDELRWEASKYHDFPVNDFRTAYKLRHRAERFEAGYG